MNVIHKHTIVISCLLGILTGCKQVSFQRGTDNTVPLSLEEQERLHDVSFPPGVVLHKLSLDDQQSIVQFTTSLTFDELISFFKKEFSYYGWVFQTLFLVKDVSYLVFAKTGKSSLIKLKTDEENRVVQVFIEHKKRAP